LLPELKALNWRDGESNSKILQHSAAFFQRFDHGAAVKMERKMSHLNIAFDRYACIGTVMRYILVISKLVSPDRYESEFENGPP